MYDLVGGGFHRYSVDEHWLVPHFEKMLYDNALLVPAYLHAWVVTGEERYRRVVEETVEYVLRELRLDGGGFASAQDADTDGVEGLTFTWTAEELEAAIGPGRDALLQPFEHGRFVLRGALTGEERAALFAARERRPKPLRDDKAIASWNGLMLAALAEAGRRLERADWLDAARTLAEFLLGPLSDGERLHRTWRDGRRRRGRATSRTTRTSRTASTSCTSPPASRAGCVEARRLAAARGRRSSPTTSAAASSSRRRTEKPLVARKKDLDDNPTPSGNSMLAFVLLRLARIWGDDELERRAVGVLRLVRDVVGARTLGLRLGALRARPPFLAAARAGDPRRAGERRRPRGPARLRSQRRRRLRPGRRRAAPGGEDARRRPAGRLRLRALRLPRAGDRPSEL